MRGWAFWLWAATAAIAGPAVAQDADIAPVPVKAPAQAAEATPAPAPDSDVAPFYASHPNLLIWLRDSDTRVAAAKLVDILKRAPIDGLPDGTTLASTVEAAIARRQPLDDQSISTAWVRYVQAMKRPVEGVSFGDPSLQLKAPSANDILTVTAATPSLAAHIDSIVNPNPLYAQLRDDAITAGQQDDPHVRASLDRLRLIPARGRAILVDAANAQLTMIEDGKAVDTMKVIVGQAKYPTPLIASKIWYVTFNPYWHIPTDVARRKVAPIVLKRGVGYLKLARYQTVEAFGGDKEQPVDPTGIDWKAVAAGTAEAHIRQLSGPHNMMGAMKFGFVNDYGIFLHDTPEKALFAKDPRNLSLGCVRVEHPKELAQWLLGHESEAPGDDSEQNVLIGKTGVPIYISYLTARPDGQTIAFADDVYKLDGASGGQPSATAEASAKK
jgi:murein L,D-transpeptidase YcbB/YkuD